jgi:hypothetical protein
MSPEEVVLETLTWAKANNVKLIRGAIFNFCDETASPYESRRAAVPACGALGAVLLKAGLENLCYDGFKLGWDERLRKLLGADRAWVWRFNHGWNRGNCLTFEVEEKGKTKIVKDEVSHWGDKLARQHASR